MFLLPFSAALGESDEGSSSGINLDSIHVKGLSVSATGSFSPGIDGDTGLTTKTKKVTTTNLKEMPPIFMNNQRQLQSRNSGLLVSEVSNEGWMSVSYRGIGDPHESYNVLILEDGIPVVADMFGYPAAYYAPPSELVEQTQFFRGGAGLLFGPQPGGALNFKIRRSKELTGSQLRLSESFGDFGSRSRFWSGALKTTRAKVFGSFHERSSAGFRAINGDYNIRDFSMDVSSHLSEQWTMSLRGSSRQSEHGEAGGLARRDALNVDGFEDDPRASTTPNDRLRLGRRSLRLDLDYLSPSHRSSGTVRAWSEYFARYSKRQNKTTPTFGGLANGSTNTIQNQEFQTTGLELRWDQKLDFWNGQHRWLIGGLVYSVNSPFRQELGSSPAADNGDLRRAIDRETRAQSLFTEFEASWGEWTLSPSLRLDRISQSVVETTNVGAVVPLRNNRDDIVVPLVGFGVTKKLTREFEYYANVSQAYKPVTFQDAVPLDNGDSISGDIEPGRALTLETGIRSTGVHHDFNWDMSLFRTDYDNIFGRVGNRLQNVGRGVYEGLELASEYNLLSSGGRGLDADRLDLMLGATFLDATFKGGPLVDKTPQYAPPVSMRGGLVYKRVAEGFGHGARAGLNFSYVSSHFGDDGNSLERSIPAYVVWDVSAELPIWRDFISLFAGVNNVFDAKYFSRVRANGIDPGLPRNAFYGVVGQWAFD